MKKNSGLMIRALCALAFALPVAAHAYLDIDLGRLSDRNMEMSLDWSRRLNEMVNEEKVQKPQERPRVTRASLAVGDPFAVTQGIEALVARYPVEEQPQRAKEYTRLILAFNDTMPRTYGIPKNNLATALAAVLAGSYAAYTNRSFPDNAVKPLYRQLERMMIDNPEMTKISKAEKVSAYQIWVGLGMVMLMGQDELAKQPNPAQQAQLRQLGGETLQKLLKVTPDRVRFSVNGMEFR